MQWKPFVEDCVRIVRDDHSSYVMQADLESDHYFVKTGDTKVKSEPYKLILFAVTVDPIQAVQRSILRNLTKGRGVPIPALLLSHKRFSQNFLSYVPLFDEVTLFDNNMKRCYDENNEYNAIYSKCVQDYQPTIINEVSFQNFLKHSSLNEEAEDAASL